MESGRLEPYKEHLAQLLVAAGCDVVVVRTNTYFQDFSHYPRDRSSLRFLIDEVRRFNPDVLVTVNRSGVSPEIFDVTGNAPVITIFQDPHFYGTQELLTFGDRDFLFFILSSQTQYEGVAVPFVTSRGAHRNQIENVPLALDSLTFFPTNGPRDLDACFVGTAPSTDFVYLLAACVGNRPLRSALIRVYLEHRRTHSLDVKLALKAEGFDFDDQDLYRDLYREQDYPTILDSVRAGRLTLQGLFDEQVNAELRTKHVSALADVNLAFYGLPDVTWIHLMILTEPALLLKYRFHGIDDSTQLAALYNRSKLGLNSTRVATEDSGLSFRVAELMACETLLLTDRASVAALGHIGLEEGVHFVSYGDADEARDQSAFLLNHPDELASIASRGRQAIEDLGPTATTKGLLALCMKSCGFGDIASDIERVTPDGMQRTSALFYLTRRSLSFDARVKRSGIVVRDPFMEPDLLGAPPVSASLWF